MKKSNIASFIAGAIIFGSVGVFAGQYNATDNPFPIQLNGSSVSIEGYNINGSTYFKLRDIADVVGGFWVNFYDNTIHISNNESARDMAQAAEAGINTDISETEAIKLVKAYYQRQEAIEDPDDEYDDYNYFWAEDYGKYYIVHASGGNPQYGMAGGSATYQIHKTSKEIVRVD